MRLMRVRLLLALALFGAAGIAGAQSTTGTIRGHVEDSQGLALPGVTVSVASSNLQRTRTVVTSEYGDYVLNLLPSGTYTVTFELSGFERQQRSINLAPTQELPLDVKLGLSGINEEVSVTARTADVLTSTAQVATNFKQELISSLPTTRDINASVLLAPAVHATGPSGAYSISGSMSFENLFMINGVTVSENLRGQPLDLYVEDAIQETTVATGGISAEYGRFSGGVVNVITRSGGNSYSGSYRATLNNDDWRRLTPFETSAIATDPKHKDTRLDDVVPTHEYTLGGPLRRDRLWFFAAGRMQTQAERRTLLITQIPYDYSRPTQRYEGKGTYSLSNNHRVQADYIKILDERQNYTTQPTSMDMNSLGTRKDPQDLFTINYSGSLRSNFFVEALWSQRHSRAIGVGAKTTDLIEGTLLLDRARGNTRYWSDTFCGVCAPEARDNQNFHAKASYFASTGKYGSHSAVFGYDNFNDIRRADNHQSGSDYRILGTTSIIRGAGDAQVIYPQFLGNGSTIIQWNPIPTNSLGSSFRTHGVFANDAWRINNRLTANLGLRYDLNHGLDQAHTLVTTDSAISPRFGIVWDPTASQSWIVTASYAQYVDAIANSIADAGSAAGNPQTYQFIYRGADINGNANATSLTETDAAVRQVFEWYDANKGSLPLNGNPTIPGVATKVGGDLKSPSVTEYAGGVARQLGRAAVRIDYVYRDWKDFYVQRTDTTTGHVQNSFGQTFDLTLIENTNDLKRRYSGGTFQATYRFGSVSDIGTTYTLSRTWGNVDGESVNGGPSASTILQYPEYKQPSWNYPDGDLSTDQRHRARLWINYSVPRVSGLTVSLLEILESGVPYNASSGSGVDPRPFVSVPSYVTPPAGNATTYYFPVDCAIAPSAAGDACVGGGARDSFRTEGQKRTDFAATYNFRLSAAKGLNLFVQAQIINLFNQEQLCGCGGTVFQNGGAVTQTNIDQTVRTAATNPANYQTFNPFAAAPVQETNWAYGPLFGQALNRLAWTSPRQFRIGFGVRF